MNLLMGIEENSYFEEVIPLVQKKVSGLDVEQLVAGVLKIVMVGHWT